MKNEFTSQSLAEAFAEHRARLLSLVEKRLNPVLNKRLSREDVMQEVYLAAAKRLPYFAQNEDVPIYFKLRTILLQTLADIERKNLQAAGRDAYREAEVGDDTTSERAPGALNWGRFAADVTSPLSRVDRDERHAVLRAAVAALPENDRAIIVLRHFDGMGNSACAAALRSLAAELDELGNEAEERVPEIPDFQLTDVLGRGGMGTVYLAEQLSLGRKVALKVVNSAVATRATLPRGGTRRYMAPELLEGCKATEASDQYALGVALRELAPGGDADFAAICARATAPDPARRYAGMDAMLDDLRRFLAHRPVAANPPSLFRRLRLFARRNPLAASGIVAASILLAAFVAALAVGYMKTSRALAATEQEAASAAQSLAKVVAEIDRTDSDRRDAEIVRALTAAERLASRFPGNAEIADAVERLKAARDAHARFLERRSGAMRLQHRFRSALRHEQ